MARILTRSNRPIVIQEAQSGMDMLLSEVSKYVSPEYQQQRKENERADARFELQVNAAEENKQRYQDSLAQQSFQNQRLEDNDKLNNKLINNQLEDRTLKQALDSFNEDITSTPIHKIKNMNLESYSITDESNPILEKKINDRIKSIQNRYIKKNELADTRRARYNTSTGQGYEEDMNSFFLGDEYSKFISNDIFKDPSSVTPRTKLNVEILAKKVSASENQLEKLIEKILPGKEISEVESSRIEALKTDIALYYRQMNELANPVSSEVIPQKTKEKLDLSGIGLGGGKTTGGVGEAEAAGGIEVEGEKTPKQLAKEKRSNILQQRIEKLAPDFDKPGLIAFNYGNLFSDDVDVFDSAVERIEEVSSNLAEGASRYKPFNLESMLQTLSAQENR